MDIRPTPRLGEIWSNKEEGQACNQVVNEIEDRENTFQKRLPPRHLKNVLLPGE